MKCRQRWLIKNYFYQLKQRFWPWLKAKWNSISPNHRCYWQFCCLVVVIGLSVRSLPYAMPIRATDLVQDDLAVEFRDRNGLSLGTLLSRDQTHTAVVSLDQISPNFVQAILAAEDERFYQHGPLDLQAIARAIAEAVQARQIVSGASTITMQLARMIDPTPHLVGGKAGGKVQEVWQAWRLAAGMSKDEILQTYMNRLPMGGNLYGVEAAAQVYFGVRARDLNVAQASLLAALPNDPTRLNPYDSWDALKQRQIYVLKQMVKARYLDRVQADRALAETVTLRSRQQGIIAAPHFLFWLADHLPANHPGQVQTTLDLPLQQFVEAQVQQVIQTLAPHNAHQAAALVLDNHSGAVLAYVGSTDYFADREGGRNDGVQALRQPGSTLKPFLYELALEKRVIHPNTVLADVPTYYPIPGARLYNPVDYSGTFQGPVRVRLALANSLNVPAIRVLEKVGVATFLDRLHQLGFQHLIHSPDYYGLGLTLGSGEVTLWELAHAYLTMANQGESTPVLSGALSTSALYTLTPVAYSQYAAATWALLTDMLSDRYARAKSFGVNSVLSLPFAVAVKTGTSSDFRDTWTMGFTRDYTVATWVGNFSGEPMQQVSGVTGAAPLWSRIVLHLHEQQDPGPFAKPDGLVQKPICALSGMRPQAACPSIVQEYFYPEDLNAYATQPDRFYQAIASAPGQPPRYRLNLPPEYNEWLATQPQTSLESGQLKIIAPRNGDYFLMTPGQAGQRQSDRSQRLEFKLAALPPRSVEWWLNGKQIATQTSDTFFWPLQPGEWTLQVKDGVATDQVKFQVGWAEQQPVRRGFSIVKP
jgi:penicillin-binding protein 1C